MADNVTNELILEHLKALRDEAVIARQERHEIRDQLTVIKGHVSTLVQSDLSRDTHHAGLLSRIERIERRLELSGG